MTETPPRTIRMADTEWAELKTRAQTAGQSVSHYVRESLELRKTHDAVVKEMLDDHEHRLNRLEESKEAA